MIQHTTTTAKRLAKLAIQNLSPLPLPSSLVLPARALNGQQRWPALSSLHLCLSVCPSVGSLKCEHSQPRRLTALISIAVMMSKYCWSLVSGPLSPSLSVEDCSPWAHKWPQPNPTHSHSPVLRPQEVAKVAVASFSHQEVGANSQWPLLFIARPLTQTMLGIPMCG